MTVAPAVSFRQYCLCPLWVKEQCEVGIELADQFRVVEVVRRQVGRGRARQHVNAPAHH